MPPPSAPHLGGVGQALGAVEGSRGVVAVQQAGRAAAHLCGAEREQTAVAGPAGWAGRPAGGDQGTAMFVAPAVCGPSTRPATHPRQQLTSCPPSTYLVDEAALQVGDHQAVVGGVGDEQAPARQVGGDLACARQGTGKAESQSSWVGRRGVRWSGAGSLREHGAGGARASWQAPSCMNSCMDALLPGSPLLLAWTGAHPGSAAARRRGAGPCPAPGPAVPAYRPAVPPRRSTAGQRRGGGRRAIC